VPYLVDSDWAIDHLNRVTTAVDLLRGLAPEGTFISIVTYIEAFQGVVRDPRPDQAMAALEDLLRGSPILDLTVPIAERTAQIRQELLDQGKCPARRGFDIVIAATAIEHDLTLVTRNVGDYADHPPASSSTSRPRPDGRYGSTAVASISIMMSGVASAWTPTNVLAGGFEPGRYF
jgi:predicted nucleic acid-binding protein